MTLLTKYICALSMIYGCQYGQKTHAGKSTEGNGTKQRSDETRTAIGNSQFDVARTAGFALEFCVTLKADCNATDTMCRVTLDVQDVPWMSARFLVRLGAGL